MKKPFAWARASANFEITFVRSKLYRAEEFDGFGCERGHQNTTVEKTVALFARRFWCKETCVATRTMHGSPAIERFMFRA